MPKKEKVGAVRVCRFEVFKVAGDDWRETYQRWHHLSGRCKQIVNFIWEQWLVWHVQNRSADKVRSFLEQHAAWKKAADGTAKPKMDVSAWPKELDKIIYSGLSEFSDVNVRVQSLLQNVTKQKVNSRKAANGSLPGWEAILLRNESVPSSTRPQPIPYDSHNASLPTKREDGNWWMSLRIDRVACPGKPAKSHLDEVQLRVKSRGGQQALLERIASGEYAFKGSSLVYSKQNRKWFVLVCYQQPAGECHDLDGNRVAILRPGRKSPWRLRILGKRSFRVGGEGAYIGHQRNRLLTHRWSRQENYRQAGSANKGHGRERALAPIERLSHWWKDFTKTANHTVTKQVIDICLREGIGTLVYVQPAGRNRDTRFLSTAGKVPNRHDSTGWDWFQVGSMLGYKSKDAGLHLVLKKSSDKEPGDGTQAKPRPNGNRPVSGVRSDDRGSARRRGGRKAEVVSGL